MSAATVGASVPTASDSVFFDANSNSSTTAFTVTMSVSPRLCNDFTASGLDGTMTLSGTSIGLTISGNLTFQATNFNRNYSGTTTFNATTTGKTVTTNGVAFGALVDFNGVGGGWTLGSAFTTSGALQVSNGSFNTSTSNYSVSTSGLFSTTSTTRTITLNASTLTGTSGTAVSLVTTNLTFNAGTSTINCSGTGAGLLGGGATFSTVNFTSTNNPNTSITGANTFTNLTIATPTVVGINSLTLSADQTVTGTLTLGATNSATGRVFVLSNTLGTARTLTVATIATLSDVDFRDITAAGASGTWSGTRLGNCQGNSNITFEIAFTASCVTTALTTTGSPALAVGMNIYAGANYLGVITAGSANSWTVSIGGTYVSQSMTTAGKTVYYNLATGTGWTSTAWATSSGGTPALNNFPLAQDTAVFDNSSTTSTGTITYGLYWNIGTLDMSARTSALTFNPTGTDGTPIVYGSWKNGTGVTLSGTTLITFVGRTATQQITSNGIAFTQPITVDNATGTVQLVDDFTTDVARTFTLTTGTLDLNGKKLSTGLFSGTGITTRTIAFGVGNITCTGTGSVWTTATPTNLTTTGTQVVNVTSVGSTAITVTPGALSETNSISFNFTGGTYALSFLSASTYTARNIDFTGFAGTWNATATNTIYGNLKLSTGMTLTASGSVFTFGATSGTQQITTNAKTLDFPITFNGVGGTFQLQDALTMGSARNLTLTNGTLDLNGKTLTAGTALTTATGTKNLTFNGGTLVCPTASTTAFNNAVPTGFTTTAGTGSGTISMTASTAKTFVGGGSTFNCTLQNAGAGALTVSGSNTFTGISNSVQPTTFTFTSGTTQTLTNWSVSGTAGNLVTIGATTTSAATLSKASGTVSSDYLSISYSTATGGATWYAGANSTDGGNNTGWIFTAPSSGNFFLMFN
jgi:hypothetical protein